MVQGIFKIVPRLRDRHFFMWQSRKILNVFNTLTLTQVFWKTKTFFKKLEYHFLVESTKIENASFPYKTAISEANAKTNRIMTTKWAYRKKCFDSNSFIFFFNFVLVYKPLIKSWFVAPTTQISIFVLL